MTLGSGKKAVIKVKVQKTAVKTTKLTLPKTATVKVKKTLTLKPVLTPVTSSEKITYTTSNKKIATVNKNHRKVSILSNQLKRKRIGMANGKNRLNTIYIFQTTAGMFAPNFLLCNDHGNSAYGIWKNNGN